MPDTYLVQCAGCGTRNRIPHEKAARPGRCGRCGALLLPSHALPLTVSDSDWDEQVLGSSVPAAVEVWTPRCGVCAQYEVSVRHLAAALFGRARVLQLNADENPATAARYDVRGVPTVLLFRDGNLVSKLLGPQGERGIREILKV